MADTVDRVRRSANMRAIPSKDTKPELLVRSIAHRLGYRFRLHRRDIPGTPDLAFIGRRKAIFVHGCLWHGHQCRRARLPSTNADFWRAKIERNKERDAAVVNKLFEGGWTVLTIWQCEMKDRATLGEKIKTFLEASR